MVFIKKYDIVLFDLDGTLLDTSPGVFNSVRYAEEQLGLSKCSYEKLKRFVGPPPSEMYMQVHGLSRENAEKAVAFHRVYGKEKAVYEAQKYDGMEQCLLTLKNAGFRLAVTTLKAEAAAHKILEHFCLAEYFDVILGMNDSETLTKADLINKARNMLGNGKSVIVGDTIYDYKGAVDAGVDFIPVLYGFGFSSESEFEGMDNVCGVAEMPLDIVKFVTK